MSTRLTALSAATIAIALGALGCDEAQVNSDTHNAGSGCRSHDDCAADQVCLEGDCRTPCIRHTDCAQLEQYCVQGVCAVQTECAADWASGAVALMGLTDVDSETTNATARVEPESPLGRVLVIPAESYWTRLNGDNGEGFAAVRLDPGTYTASLRLQRRGLTAVPWEIFVMQDGAATLQYTWPADQQTRGVWTQSPPAELTFTVTETGTRVGVTVQALNQRRDEYWLDLVRIAYACSSEADCADAATLLATAVCQDDGTCGHCIR